ncbi:MAG: SbcC/MukB-like Walker B domain-containing protein [bacterium]|nr:SbcC/MukB-like Walker B domain-containing protein [bacterium]MDY4099640.1 SbcC/MukB-like Walker B domain-containing protein [Lachnospiraceae bacterium]
MSDRFQMNRIGFVNFWLYDEEDFEFSDGKLLLRGQNGSGKSITTQSFIPFVLDGDRTPSRLDPFGSSDRRMEYYFLGEEGKDEATGYLFLEFKREHSHEYRTIGIGQRAKRGKPMDFWGFIILDGRRIGYDLWLYKEVGSNKIPLDKRELRAELGEDNIFTDSQSEYKKAVNHHLFGFRKAEQYEQFIRLLVKVRAPKLSKEFKPTKVYEILNDSLQTLTDEDLRAMVDAMEKMDEIQDSLEMLGRAFSDVKIIRNEYTRYNQYMLAKKAQGYLSKKQEVERARQQLEEQEARIRDMEQEQQEKTEKLTGINERKALAETERNGLMDTDMEEIDHKLELARGGKEVAEELEQRWIEKAEAAREKILQQENQLRELNGNLELYTEELAEQKQELVEAQETLQWEAHVQAMNLLGLEQYEGTDDIAKQLSAYKVQIENCRKTIRRYEETAKAYDEAASRLDALNRKKTELEQRTEEAERQTTEQKDCWIKALYDAKDQAEVWHPSEDVLLKAEQKVSDYEDVSDAGAVRELLRTDYEGQRQALGDAIYKKEREKEQISGQLAEAEAQLAQVQAQEELEPARDPYAEESRKALAALGITALPFYKTVEFSEKLDDPACAALEAQLEKAGILDALVVAPKDLERVRKECPEFADAVINVTKPGTSGFAGLTVSEELEGQLRTGVQCILSNLYVSQPLKDGSRSGASGIEGENDSHAGADRTGGAAGGGYPGADSGQGGIYLGADGWFTHGMLSGRAKKDGDAEYVGQLARRRKKEQKIRQLQELISELKEQLAEASDEITGLRGQMEQLEREYGSVPDFAEIDRALAKIRACTLELQMMEQEFTRASEQEQRAAQEKNQAYQVMLQSCKPFPYGRTEQEYDEVLTCIEEYRSLWQECREVLFRLASERSRRSALQERIEQEEQAMDDALVEKRRYSTSIKEYDIQIRQYEEYLNRPENIEKARRLQELREELETLEKEYITLRETLIRLDEKLQALRVTAPGQKAHLQEMIAEESCLRSYFEEELALGLVFEREGRALADCAKEALTVLRDSDKNRELTDLFNSLYQVYQKHNGSLTSYGTSLEECFGEVDEVLMKDGSAHALRQRMRIVSVWNGKKVYLEEFYRILKNAIDETELLIQQKDRELFEDILSQTISQQLTDRIAESRKWVSDMSKLMKEMDTSMGLTFSLDWKPRTADNDAEIDTAELEQILLRDRDLLTMEDIEKVAAHFRSKIRMEKRKLEEAGGMINYMELVREALDYRRWFEFQMYFRRGAETRKPLTNAAFNRFSGGEKAMAMYVPLFAAVNAQYKKADYADHPRMIALDEAFAGVDDKNISSMFELVEKLDFDYIMNSQALWGCFETVKGLRIAELRRPMNSQVVTVIRFTWNGHERMLDV